MNGENLGTPVNVGFIARVNVVVWNWMWKIYLQLFLSLMVLNGSDVDK